MKYTITEVGASVGAFVLLYVSLVMQSTMYFLCVFLSGCTMDFPFGKLCLDCNCSSHSHFETSSCGKGLTLCKHCNDSLSL